MTFREETAVGKKVITTLSARALGDSSAFVETKLIKKLPCHSERTATEFQSIPYDHESKAIGFFKRSTKQHSKIHTSISAES